MPRGGKRPGAGRPKGSRSKALRFLQSIGPLPTSAWEVDSAIKKSVDGGGGGGDLMAEARETIALVMRGEGGRGSQARLMAAEMVLGNIAALSDAELIAECKRR